MKYPAHHHDRHKLKGNICSFGIVKEAARQQNIVSLLVLVEKPHCRTPQAVFCNTKRLARETFRHCVSALSRCIPLADGVFTGTTIRSNLHYTIKTYHRFITRKAWRYAFSTSTEPCTIVCPIDRQSGEHSALPPTPP